MLVLQNKGLFNCLILQSQHARVNYWRVLKKLEPQIMPAKRLRVGVGVKLA